MVEFEFEEKEVKATSGEGPMDDIPLSACDLRLLRLRLKKKRAGRSEMTTSPPITPAMIESVGLVVEELDEESDELPDGTLVGMFEERVFEDVEDSPTF